jgi:hypothetical protein
MQVSENAPLRVPLKTSLTKVLRGTTPLSSTITALRVSILIGNINLLKDAYEVLSAESMFLQPQYI